MGRPRRLVHICLAMLGGTALGAEPVLEVAPGQLRPGDALVVDLHVDGACPVAWIGARPLFFHPHRRRCRALAGVPVELATGELPIRVGSVEAQRLIGPRMLAPTDAGSPHDGSPNATPEWPPVPLELPPAGAVEVLPAAFAQRELTVAPQFIEPPPSVQLRMAEDRRAFAAAFAQPFLPPRFRKSFIWPRDSRITATFGDKRTFNGVQQSQHYGIDLDGQVGAPIHAANDGVVVMVRDNYAAGRTVVIHHGLNLYTVYFHLSRFDVRQGQSVKRGQLLGRVGQTGRVTGPHLHWGVKVGELYVDPTSVLRLDLER
ncbi:MAG TPA: M23 family metallopeptidase [Myxococcaceae bacterium]|nr:M23 family metallopeptidase [Myxococcaceae bacterium]